MKCYEETVMMISKRASGDGSNGEGVA